MRFGFNIVAHWEDVAIARYRKLLGIPLLNHTEAPKLTLYPIEVTVVISVVADETVTADVIESFHALDHMYGKWQLR